MKPYLNSHSQSGAILILTLIVLLIITVLGASSVESVSLLEKMARNTTDTSIAFRAAEAAIIEAELVVESDTALTSYQANAGGKYELQAVGGTPRWTEAATWNGVNAVEVDYSDGMAKPQYIIEFEKSVLAEEDRLNMDNVGGETGSARTQMFRLTALGTGKTESAKVVLQSTYGKKF
jgi:type IV pilus assembly protein PilX